MAAALAAALPLLLSGFSPSKPDAKQPAEFSLISGTVYRPPGFSLAGAEIVLEPEQKKSGNVKFHKQTALSDSRGEFAFRVSTVPMKYTVTVKRSGYVSQVKTVEIERRQHREMPFTLEPESRKE